MLYVCSTQAMACSRVIARPSSHAAANASSSAAMRALLAARCVFPLVGRQGSTEGFAQPLRRTPEPRALNRLFLGGAQGCKCFQSIDGFYFYSQIAVYCQRLFQKRARLCII